MTRNKQSSSIPFWHFPCSAPARRPSFSKTGFMDQGVSVVFVRWVAEAFAHQPLGQVHHRWPSGWRWPHRPQASWLRWERKCWSCWSLAIVLRICAFFWDNYLVFPNCQSPYRYIYIYSMIYHVLSHSLNPWVDLRENALEIVLFPSYYRPNRQSQVPPPDRLFSNVSPHQVCTYPFRLNTRRQQAHT